MHLVPFSALTCGLAGAHAPGECSHWCYAPQLVDGHAMLVLGARQRALAGGAPPDPTAQQNRTRSLRPF